MHALFWNATDGIRDRCMLQRPIEGWMPSKSEVRWAGRGRGRGKAREEHVRAVGGRQKVPGGAGQDQMADKRIWTCASSRALCVKHRRRAESAGRVQIMHHAGAGKEENTGCQMQKQKHEHDNMERRRGKGKKSKGA